MLRNALSGANAAEALASPAATHGLGALEVLFAIILFIVGFNVVFVLGHLLNSISALVLDRWVVKKLLGYPFELYQYAADHPDETASYFRSRVAGASYFVYLVNLVPLILIELVLAYRAEGLMASIERRWYLATAVAIVLTLFHFGVPFYGYRTVREQFTSRAARWVGILHVVFNLLTAVGLYSLLRHHQQFAIPVLILVNLLIGAVDRICSQWERLQKRGTVRITQRYLRSTFINPIYSAAKLVSYAKTPAPEVIKKAQELAGPLKEDFFWSCYLLTQSNAPVAFTSIYHFLALYGMSRNLCNATFAIWVWSVISFLFRSPHPVDASVIIWSVALAGLTYVFFFRFLYFYASYFSRYVVRVAAVAQRTHEMKTERMAVKRPRLYVRPQPGLEPPPDSPVVPLR
jgi:hypothetical protein